MFGVLLGGVFAVTSTHAYPNAISMNYPSCISCHYHPAGNGILTDYGRTIGVNYYSAKPFWNPGVTEEKIEKYGEFFPGYNSITKYIRPQLNYRGLQYWSGINATNPISPNYIAMRADASLVVRADEENHFFVEGSVGKYPTVGSDTLISRYYYIAYRPRDELGFYVGLMDAAFGLQIPDHIAYSRSATGLAQNDQTHSLLVHYLRDNYELFVQAFAGNLTQSRDTRQKGGSAMFEFAASAQTRYGISLLHSANDYRKRDIAAFTVRHKVNEGTAIIGEFGALRYNTIATDESTLGFYSFIQPSIRLVRGLYSLWTFDLYAKDWFKGTPRFIRIAPGIQWFAIPKVEFRADMQLARTIGFASGEADPLTLMLQVSAWL